MKKSVLSIVVIVLMATAIYGFSGNANAAPAPSGMVAVTGVSWFAPNSTQQVSPGMNEIPLFVTFVNTVNIPNLTVRLNLSAYAPGTFNYSYIIGTGKKVNEQYFFPILHAGSSTTIEQTVNVSSSARTGIYVENLSFSFVNGSAPLYGNYTFNLPLSGSVSVVSPTALFGTQSSPLIGTPGLRNVPVTVMLENTGTSAATNVSVSYTPDGNLYGATQHTTLSALPAFSAVPVTFLASVRSDAALNQVYSQNLTVSFYGSSHRVPFTLPITGSSNLSVVNYYTNPPVVFQGQRFISLTVVTENSGSSFARNVSVSASSNAFTVATNPYNISYFPSGKILNFTFLVNALNVTGQSAIVINMGSMSVRLPIFIHSHGSYSISPDIPALHTGASSQLLTFNVTNNGKVNLYDFTLTLLSPSVISLHIPSSNPLAALTETNVTFAEIDPGQTVTATFLVDVSSSATFASYPAQLAVSWRLNNSVTPFHQAYNFNEKVTPTGIQNLQSLFTFTPLNIAVLVLIIALIIGLVALAGRGRKLKKEAESLRRKTPEPFKQLPHKESGAGENQQDTGGFGEDRKR